MRSILLFIFLLSLLTVKGQSESAIVYGNPNHLVDEFRMLGDNKLLVCSDKFVERNRMLFLLDKNNLVTDTLKTNAVDDLLILNDSTFQIVDLNYLCQFTIRKNKFHPVYRYGTLSKFKKIGGCDLLVHDYLIGDRWVKKANAVEYTAINMQGKNLESTGVIIGNKAEYDLSKGDTLRKFIYSRSNAKMLESQIILSTENTKNKRTERYWGFNKYVYNKKYLFLFEPNSQSIFQFDLKNNLRLVNTYKLPIKNAKLEAWNYYYDYKTEKHYVVKRILEKEEILKKRETLKGKALYSVFQLIPNNKKLKSLTKTSFEPVCFHKDILYQVSQHEKGFDVIGYALNDSVKFDKSHLILGKAEAIVPTKKQ